MPRLLEAAGGTLDIKDALGNTDEVEASGHGSTVTLEGNVTNTGGTLLATGGGELDVKAATAITGKPRRHGTDQHWLGAIGRQWSSDAQRRRHRPGGAVWHGADHRGEQE